MEAVLLARQRRPGDRFGIEARGLERGGGCAPELDAQPAPALAGEPHELAARLEQKRDLIGRERRVLRLEREREIEPVAVHGRLDEIEIDAGAHRRAEQRRQVAGGEHLDPGGQRYAPVDELLRKAAREPARPLFAIVIVIEPQRGQPFRGALGGGEIEGKDFPIAGRCVVRRGGGLRPALGSPFLLHARCFG